ncbi:Nn.00g113320.m01.CDS01 [Neocucurbitaria sp. VM-36]
MPTKDPVCSWEDLGYSDKLVGLDKYKVGEAYNDRILGTTNFWIVTFAKEPYYDEAYNCISSGRGYTTMLSTAKWCLGNKRWLVQGYSINLKTNEASIAELVAIINKLNENREWFGSFWPIEGNFTKWTPWGMSLDLRREWTKYEQGRHPITAGEPKLSITIQEAEEAVQKAREQKARVSIKREAEEDVAESIEEDIIQSIEEDVVESIEKDVVESIEKDVVESIEEDVVESIEEDVVESIEEDVIESIEEDVMEGIEYS